MNDDRIKCRAKDCEQLIVPARRPTLFCWSCESTLQHQADELEQDVHHTLRLEAEFIQWCEEHGQPHPHE